jgi:hypothetical protein
MSIEQTTEARTRTGSGKLWQVQENFMKRYLSAIILVGAALASQTTAVRAQTGNSQASPFFPNSTTATSSTFLNAVSSAPNGSANKWFQATVAVPSTGFRYQMTNSSLFIKINDFPTGFPTPFTVKVGSTTIGAFLPGQSVDFQALLGGGVTQFDIIGINPATTAFPLAIAFDTPSSNNFTVTAIGSVSAPEPGSLALIGLGLSMGAGRFCKRRKVD